MSFTVTLNASMVLETRVIDLRADLDAEVIHASFPFEIIGKPVTVRTVRSNCGCTTTGLKPRTYQPGEKGVIDVRFNLAGRVGKQRMRVAVATDDADEPEIELQLNVLIPHVLRIEPRFIYWEKDDIPYETQSIMLLVDVDEPIELASISSDQDQLHIVWEREDSRNIRVDLTPVVPEGDAPFFRAVIRVDVASEHVQLKRRTFHSYAFMKN